MKRLKLYIVFFLLGSGFVSCNKFLEYNPQGNLNEEEVKQPENIESLVNAAYATLDNSIWYVPYGNLWAYGDVRSDDTYKGGLGQADGGDFNAMELFNLLSPDNGRNTLMWQRLFIALSRVNLALDGLNEVDDQQLPEKETRVAEMHFLRGHYYFLLKTLYKYFPVVTETMTSQEIDSLSNREFTDQELWNKVADEFQMAMDHLPPAQAQIGRANRYAAEAYLAKTRLFQAYEQDDDNQVTHINTQYLQDVVTLTDDLMNSPYDLFDDFANNFLASYDNGVESIFAIQHSINDGTSSGRVDRDNALNFPMNSEYGCCSFNRPSQNLVNAYQTGADGLPLFDTYNTFNLNQEGDFQNHSFDPRVDHTVGIPGHPYKYQNEMIYVVDDFTRAPGIYGPFSNMKPAQLVDCGCMVKLPGSAFVATSKTIDIIRFDEVLLWRAEALIQLGRQDEALPLINRIRERAKNSTSRLQYGNGDAYSNYHIEAYQLNADWTQEYALQALKWESRLEFATEGKRFFNLVRWGDAKDVMDDYFDVEKDRFQYLSLGEFTSGRDEYLPIPDVEIQLSNKKYQQNVGYN